MVPVMRPPEDSVRHAHDIIPERLPLVLLVPNVRTLEERNDQPLGLHEHRLRRADLGLHGVSTFVPQGKRAELVLGVASSAAWL